MFRLENGYDGTTNASTGFFTGISSKENDEKDVFQNRVVLLLDDCGMVFGAFFDKLGFWHYGADGYSHARFL